MKIKELLKSLIETQKEVKIELQLLNKNIKPQIDRIEINGDSLTSCNITLDRLDNYIETSVYNKEQTVEAINKECDYRQNFKECDEKNSALLNLIQDYCKFEDKYEIIDLFRRIDSLYEVKRRKGDNK